MRRKEITIALAMVILTTATTTGFLLENFTGREAIVPANSGGEEATASNLYTYPVGVASGKTFIITVETNWTPKPKVSLPRYDTEKSVELIFLGNSSQTVFYNITIPTDLLWGNISLVWKYYPQSPDRYTLSNNGTHNSLQMTFQYDPYFSGKGYFEIHGTEAAW
jgi:hypothetical protein